jgi:Na+-driven multidrug efflux pump
MYFALSCGVKESVGIYCAQAWGSRDRKDRNRMFLMLKQAILILCLNYFLAIVPLSFLVKKFLIKVMHTNTLTADYAQQLIFFCLPALFVRGITDTFKSYAQAQDIIAQVGYYTLINLVCVPFYTYLLIYKLELGPFGYGLSLLIYEFGSSIVALVVFKKLIHEDTKSTTLSVTLKFRWFACQVLKNFLTVFHIYMAYESVIFILTSLHDEAQIGAYTIMFSLTDMLRDFSNGFSIFGKVETNKLLGKKEYQKSKRLYFKM